MAVARGGPFARFFKLTRFLWWPLVEPEEFQSARWINSGENEASQIV